MHNIKHLLLIFATKYFYLANKTNYNNLNNNTLNNDQEKNKIELYVYSNIY